MQNTFSTPQEQWQHPFQAVAVGNTLMTKGVSMLEVENYQAVFNPAWPICAFKGRNIKPWYLVAELVWYLRGDRNDRSIEQWAQFWAKVRNPRRPYFYSNYGHYIFQERQIHRCISTLIRDNGTRQAAIIIASPQGMKGKNDKPCTYAVSFRIRDGLLNMSVSMRSNDVVKGLCVDFFQFSVLQQLLLQALRAGGMTDLGLGTYTHKADSLHAYGPDVEKTCQIALGRDVWDSSIAQPPLLSLSDGAIMAGTLLAAEEAWRLAGVKTTIDDEIHAPFTRWALDQLYQHRPHQPQP